MTYIVFGGTLNSINHLAMLPVLLGSAPRANMFVTTVTATVLVARQTQPAPA